MDISFQDAVQDMVDSLNDEAKQKGVNLQGLTYENFNTFLDEAFDDGGYTRCELFIDFADEYALQFGELESDEFTNAQHDCIQAAICAIKRQWASAHYKWSSPWEWFRQANIPHYAIMDLLAQVADNDDIQDRFQSWMEKDGYFDLVMDE